MIRLKWRKMPYNRPKRAINVIKMAKKNRVFGPKIPSFQQNFPQRNWGDTPPPKWKNSANQYFAGSLRAFKEYLTYGIPEK